MLLFYINSILMFYPKICFRKQDILKEMKCDYAQGYLMNRPLPMDDFKKCLVDNPLFGQPD